MRLWGWRRRGESGDEQSFGRSAAALALDEQLSAHLDGELEASEAAVLDGAIAADPDLALQLDELRVVRDALGSLDELRVPRPFTIEAPPAPERRAAGGLELVFRMGALAAAVAFAVVLTGDLVGLGGEGVEGWDISRPDFGGGAAEQASDAPQASAPLPASAAAPALTPAPTATPAAAEAPVATATPAPTVAVAATAVATPEPAVATPAAQAAQATPEPAAVAADDGEASPTATTDTFAAARQEEQAESAATPAAAEAQTGEVAEAAEPTVAAASGDQDGETAAAPAPAAEAPAAEAPAAEAPAAEAPAAEAPAAEAAGPTLPDAIEPLAPVAPLPDETAETDGAASLLRQAEQWLLLAAVALGGLALGLGARRRRRDSA